jgi:hypothetical protein
MRAFFEAIQQLQSEPVWGVATGGAGGSRLLYEFGSKIPLDVPVKNDSLSPEMRHFEGARGLFITCPWRLERDGTVIATSESDHEPDGSMVTAAESIIGTVVVTAALSHSGNCLELLFSDGSKLLVFPVADEASDRNDYALRLPDQWFVVRSTSIATEDRTG